MAGLTLLEVMLACFIVTSSTLGILWLLMQQRVTLNQMQARVVAMQLVSDAERQLKKSICARERNNILASWQAVTVNLLPHHRMTADCLKIHCNLCVKNTINQEKALCTSIVVSDSPCLK